MEAVNVIREVRGVINLNRRPRIYLERKNPFEFCDDTVFKYRYRFTKENVNRLIGLVQENLPVVNNNRGLPISPETHVLTALRYYARGSYEDEVADLHSISQPSVSRSVKIVSEAIARLAPRFVKFPETQEDIAASQREFFDTAGFPQVVGAIDGTHIPIKNPGGPFAQMYINRKGWYSLNVQVVCNSRGYIVDIVARWRGSAHDSRLFNESSVKHRFETGILTGILVGDQGYGVKPYLLTPLRNPATEAERAYNRSHVRTRNVVEHCFGRLKNKFRCLLTGTNMKLETTKAVVACAVLHNLSLLWNENDVDGGDDFHGLPQPEQPAAPNNVRGHLFRRRFIELNFAG